MTALPIVELVAYAIIALATSLAFGGAIFLVGLTVYERMEDWQVDRAARAALAREKLRGSTGGELQSHKRM